MTLLDYATGILGLANIILIIRRSVWNFPVAIILVILFAITFWNAKLYSDFGLQFFFIGANFYGWWAWRQNRAEAGTLVVRRMTRTAKLGWMAGALVATLAWGTLMANMTDAALPYWDASIAALSIVAQILMAQRFVENWHWWIVVNVLSVLVYHAKELVVPMWLYVAFLILAIVGLAEWRKVERK